MVTRKDITFEQAEGAAPLPEQLKLGEVSSELRALVWAAIYNSMGRYSGNLVGEWLEILQRHHVYRLHEFIDDFDISFRGQVQIVKEIISDGDYLEFFGFLEWVIRDGSMNRQVRGNISAALVKARSAYRVVNDDTIIPISNNIDVGAIEDAFALLNASRFSGARQHLRNAAAAATAAKWSDSIRESVHAVESIAKILVPGANELGPALVELEKRKTIHTALKKGFSSIYAFSSDEKGIRHALLEDSVSNVDEADAIFMLSACSAFVSYLISKTEL